jgi:hypothetical protein
VVATLLPISEAAANPFVNQTILARVKTTGNTNSFSSVVAVHTGDILEYQLFVEMADVGTVNNSTSLQASARTIQSLVPGVDGINALKFNLYEASTDQIQVNFATKVTLDTSGETQGWAGASGWSRGIVTTRTGTTYKNLLSIRPIQYVGEGTSVYVGVDSMNHHVPVFIGSGTAAVAAASVPSGGDSFLRLSAKVPTSVDVYNGAIRFNNNTVGVATTTDASDPEIMYGNLTIYIPWAYAEADGSYTGKFGDGIGIQLNGSGSFSSHTTGEYEWIIGNPAGVHVHAYGEDPLVEWSDLASLGYGVFPVSLHLTTDDQQSATDGSSLTITPEPATVALMASGGLVALVCRRKRRA